MGGITGCNKESGEVEGKGVMGVAGSLGLEEKEITYENRDKGRWMRKRWEQINDHKISFSQVELGK